MTLTPSSIGAAADMTDDPLACGDLIAWRRYAYGKAAAEDGDFVAASEMFEQALEQAPHWPPAWFALAEARESLGDVAGAAGGVPQDALGGPFRRARRWASPRDPGKGRAAERPAPSLCAPVVRRLCGTLRLHLTNGLDYRGPVVILGALDAAAPGRRFASALDIGCGTGLAGEALRSRVNRLTGVDVSPAMIARAGSRNVYDTLEACDAIGWLARSPLASFDCIVAADALPYFGDLEPVFAACRRALKDAGLFAFSVETFEGDGFRLGPAMRFAHARVYVAETAATCRLRPLLVRQQWVRREAGVETPGLICVLGAFG